MHRWEPHYYFSCGVIPGLLSFFKPTSNFDPSESDKMSKSKIEQDQNEDIVASEKDFLFIKAGGEWHKLRQQTDWTSERLNNLAIGYGKFEDALFKRQYVKKKIIDIVFKKQGRFLRAGTARGKWIHMHDEDVVTVELMRILRQIRQRVVNDESDLRKVHGSIDRCILKIEGRVEEILSTIRDLEGPPRGIKRTATGAPWNTGQATKVSKKLHTALKTVETCASIMGIEPEDELTDDEFTEEGEAEPEVSSALTVRKLSKAANEEEDDEVNAVVVDDIRSDGNNKHTTKVKKTRAASKNKKPKKSFSSVSVCLY